MSNNEYREAQQQARDAGLELQKARRQTAYVLRNPWIAQPEDTVGGWCVTLAIPATPAQGNPPIADFCTQEIAEYLARLHNAHIGREGLIRSVEPEGEAAEVMERWYASMDEPGGFRMTEPEVYVVHHHDIEKHAEHFNEGFDEAHRQGVGGEASREWLTEKVRPLLKDHVDPENVYHLADHIADALLSEADLEHTYTAAEVKVLTEAALRLGRKEALDEASVAVEAAIRGLSGMSGQHGVDHSYDGTCPLCKGDIPRITQAVLMALNHDALEEPECDCRYGHQPKFTKHEHTCSWGRWHLVQQALIGGRPLASPDAPGSRTDAPGYSDLTQDRAAVRKRYPHAHVCVSCSPDGRQPGPGCINCRNTGWDQTPCLAEGHKPQCPHDCCDPNAPQDPQAVREATHPGIHPLQSDCNDACWNKRDHP